MTDRDAWCPVVHGVTKSQIRLSYWTELIVYINTIFYYAKLSSLSLFIEKESWICCYCLCIYLHIQHMQIVLYLYIYCIYIFIDLYLIVSVYLMYCIVSDCIYIFNARKIKVTKSWNIGDWLMQCHFWVLAWSPLFSIQKCKSSVWESLWPKLNRNKFFINL